MNNESPVRVFDPQEEVLIFMRKLPHWAQPGTICFITFQTHDSLPNEVLERWLRERWDWLRRHGVEPMQRNWRSHFEKLDFRLQNEFHRAFSDRWHDHLDHCHGECVLRNPKLAEEVAKSLKHFDADRYDLTDFIVMPNHVHLPAAFRDAEQMLQQCESWKHFTATKINRHLGRKGKFWQQDGFDHLVRSEDQFEYLRRYIAENPRQAGLQLSVHVHTSKPL